MATASPASASADTGRRRGRTAGTLAICALAVALAPPALARAAIAPPAAPRSDGSWAARVVAPVTAHARPGAGRVVARLSNRAPWTGASLWLMVLGSADAGHRRWLHVELPARPNGTSAWIPADYAQLRHLDWRIEVSTERRVVTVRRRGRVRWRFRAVVGKPSTPTPHGLFAVYEVVPQPDPHAFLGSWALHLTAFSNVLTNYGGGPGRVAIHGRGGASLRDPLGHALSHGCIRVDNRDVELLARVAAPGTPVAIT